jgi:hypothetical protein
VSDDLPPIHRPAWDEDLVARDIKEQQACQRDLQRMKRDLERGAIVFATMLATLHFQSAGARAIDEGRFGEQKEIIEAVERSAARRGTEPLVDDLIRTIVGVNDSAVRIAGKVRSAVSPTAQREGVEADAVQVALNESPDSPGLNNREQLAAYNQEENATRLQKAVRGLRDRTSKAVTQPLPPQDLENTIESTTPKRRQ